MSLSTPFTSDFILSSPTTADVAGFDGNENEIHPHNTL
jgi:hypothetical protein